MINSILDITVVKMGVKKMDELTELIKRANEKLAEAQDARAEVMAYLEDKYNIDTEYENDTIEDECTWCFGIDYEGVLRLIKEKEQAAD